MSELRIGHGFDAHRLVEERPLMLGGVRIEHARGLEGDSDADALLHALADALLGAAGLGDLGRLYRPGDPAVKGLDSTTIVREVRARVEGAGWRLVNADLTVIAQAPRMAPHLDAMQASISRALEVDAGRINVKAKSTDHLGFLGREEGIAALATVLLER